MRIHKFKRNLLNFFALPKTKLRQIEQFCASSELECHDFHSKYYPLVDLVLIPAFACVSIIIRVLRCKAGYVLAAWKLRPDDNNFGIFFSFSAKRKSMYLDVIDLIKRCIKFNLSAFVFIVQWLCLNRSNSVNFCAHVLILESEKHWEYECEKESEKWMKKVCSKVCPVDFVELRHVCLVSAMQQLFHLNKFPDYPI